MDVEKDELFELAENYVERTGVSVYLTGRAGTGKTTFLKYICERTSKRHIILAPTGVAAINAGGSTIHSFFKLPLCPYLPDVKELVTEYQMPDKFRGLSKDRIKLIKTLDLLIIDEVSMVRADLMDAVDMTLRRYRRSDLPFGGIQLLMIGDAHQLSPVVREDERQYIEKVYKSPYFFDSKAVSRLKYVSVELQKIHRQKDAEFVEILNAVRDNQMTPQLLDRLNSRVGATLDCEDPIRLMTHNRQSGDFNDSKLNALKGSPRIFQAEIDGEFPESSYPADETITLKEGARVMFIRNDPDGAYYNGKIGTVTDISDSGTVIVECDDGASVCVGSVKWENSRYGLNESSGEVIQTVVGTFSQIPLRPAWAITIHKSQGLTFDNVVIDAGAAFAFGQVYVALSRCRSLEGISLSVPIRKSRIYSDEDVASFDSSAPTTEQSRRQLGSEQTAYRFDTLRRAFDFSKATSSLGWMNKVWRQHMSKLYGTEGEQLSECLRNMDAASKVTARFCQQLSSIEARAASGEDVEEFLRERLSKAAAYFRPILKNANTLVVRLAGSEVDNKEVKKKLKESSEETMAEMDIACSCILALDGDFSVNAINVARTEALLRDHTVTASRRRLRKLKPSSGSEESSDSVNEDLREALQEWRTRRFQADNVPAYTIMHQSTLLQIASFIPITREELIAIKGFGDKQFAKYGEDILEICKRFKK